jgi:hypothetical protein
LFYGSCEFDQSPQIGTGPWIRRKRWNDANADILTHELMV